MRFTAQLITYYLLLITYYLLLITYYLLPITIILSLFNQNITIKPIIFEKFSYICSVSSLHFIRITF